MDVESEFAGGEEPPDTAQRMVRVRMPGRERVALWPAVVRASDHDALGFLEHGRQEPRPLRHHYGLVVGHPQLLQLGAESAWYDSPRMRVGVQERVRAGGEAATTQVVSREDYKAEETAIMAAYHEGAVEALDVLAAEHALVYERPATPLQYDVGIYHDGCPITHGLLVAQLAVDEFRRRDVGRSPDGEDWYWFLDGQEVPQYSDMECLVRDVVNAHELRIGGAMHRGSLWWVRALHVHPRCRGDQLGGRLLAHALHDLVRGPYDLVVAEAHPEPTIFAAAPLPPGLANWATYERPPRTAVDGLARYFTRMGFLRADDPNHGAAALRAFVDAHSPERDEEEDLSHALSHHEDGSREPDRAVALYAFTGDLRFGAGFPRLGRRTRRPLG